MYTSVSVLMCLLCEGTGHTLMIVEALAFMRDHYAQAAVQDEERKTIAQKLRHVARVIASLGSSS